MDSLFPFRWNGIMVDGSDEKREEIKTLCTICCHIQSPKGKANSSLVCKKKKKDTNKQAECQDPEIYLILIPPYVICRASSRCASTHLACVLD